MTHICYDHYTCKQISIKGVKYLSQALKFIPIVSKNYAPGLQHLQDRKRPPRLPSKIPNNRMQPHNCCLVQKFPQNIHCTHTRYRITCQPPLQNEARKQPTKQCPWTLYLPSQTFLQQFSPNSYPKRAFTHILFICRVSPHLESYKSPAALGCCITKPNIPQNFSDTCK